MSIDDEIYRDVVRVLTVRDSVWNIINEKAGEWLREYKEDMRYGPHDLLQIDILYSNRCNDRINQSIKTPVSIDETMVLLDRYWEKDGSIPKSNEFSSRIFEIVRKYEKISFESSSEPSCEEVIEAPEDVPSVVPSQIYSYESIVEAVSQYALKLKIRTEGADCVIFLDPKQAFRLKDDLTDVLGSYDCVEDEKALA